MTVRRASGKHGDSGGGPVALRVVPHGDRWQVRRDASPDFSEAHSTQAEAIDAAREKLRISGGEIRIHGKNGRIREATTLGRAAMSRISAVEGISLEGEIARDLKSYDKAGLSSDERRERIAAKYAGEKAKR